MVSWSRSQIIEIVGDPKLLVQRVHLDVELASAPASDEKDVIGPSIGCVEQFLRR